MRHDAPSSFGNAPVARQTDPVTSHAAAHRVRIKANSWNYMVLGILARHGPRTDDEICLLAHTDVRHWPSLKTSRSRMKRKGLIAATGRVRKGQMEWQLKEC